MSLAEVMRAVPTGSRRARNQLEALRAGLRCPDLVDVSAKRRAKLEAFWRIHVLRASWGGEGKAPRCVTSPTRARVCELIRDPRTGKPMSLTSFKRCRRWWEERGFLAIVRPGWTPDLAPGVLREPGQDRNLSQAYVLCVPTRAQKKARRLAHGPALTSFGPLSGLCSTDGSPARTRGEASKKESLASCCYPAAPSRPEPPKGAPREGVLLLGALARVTDGWWAHLTGAFARWDSADLLYAIDHHPGGQPHLGTVDQVRNPAAWLRWRLSHWLLPDGTARPSPAEEAADRARRHRERRALEHAELGIAARAARIRAERGDEAAAPAPQRPWTPQGGSQRAERAIVGWAVPRYGEALMQPPGGPSYDPEWEAAVAAAVAAAEAEDADRA